MRVSVILSAFNEEHWIRMALDSLRQQTIPFELIVIDNGSTDCTAEIAREYTSLVFSAPRGIINAKNLGVEKANGDIIFMVDADCYYPQNYLELMLKHFENPDVVMVAGTYRNYDADPTIHKIKQAILFYLFKYAPGCATAYRRDAILSVGGYNSYIDQKSFYTVSLEQLFRFNWKIKNFGKCIFDPSVTVIHHRPRELCYAYRIDGSEELCRFCEEIGVSRF